MARPNSHPPELKGFRYLRQLGSGGFSDVYLYEQAMPKRSVAVKVLDELSDDNRAAFAAEANLMAQLSAHPYIVAIHHADVSDDGRPFFIMEYCSGPSFADRYKRQPLSVAEALRTGIHIASAIATAHASGILHRDLKPGNILTNEYGSPLLTDFGISSMVEDELATHTTTLSALSGSGATTGSQSVGLSVPWSPPEMFEDDPKPDVRSDIFSLAATIWTLLAGRTPFEIPGKSNQSLELMSRIERGAITPMDRDDVPPALISVLKKGMAVDRTQRYATAVEFARALQGVELSLSYAPTQIDVPNIGQIAPPVRPADENQDDRTRARGVTPVIAQPARPVITPPPPVEDPRDRTRMRGATTISPDAPSGPVTAGAQAAAATSAPGRPVESTVVRPSARSVVSPDASPAGSRTDKGSPAVTRRGPLIGVLAGVLVVAAVITGIVVLVPRSNTPQSGPTNSGGPIDLPPVIDPPVPGTAVASADGTSVTFTWTNPHPKKGDQYRWQRTDGAASVDQKDVTTTSQAQAVVTGVAPGTNVCIDVRILRDNNLSDQLDPPFCEVT